MRTVADIVRAHIAAHGSKIVRVEAVTKAGEIKAFVFNPLGQESHLNPLPTLQGVIAGETRKATHPDLFNCWDMTARKWRSFDLNRVLSVKCGNEAHFRLYRPRVAAMVRARNAREAGVRCVA